MMHRTTVNTILITWYFTKVNQFIRALDTENGPVLNDLGLVRDPRENEHYIKKRSVCRNWNEIPKIYCLHRNYYLVTESVNKSVVFFKQSVQAQLYCNIYWLYRNRIKNVRFTLYFSIIDWWFNNLRRADLLIIYETIHFMKLCSCFGITFFPFSLNNNVMLLFQVVILPALF